MNDPLPGADPGLAGPPLGPYAARPASGMQPGQQTGQQGYGTPYPPAVGYPPPVSAPLTPHPYPVGPQPPALPTIDAFAAPTRRRSVIVTACLLALVGVVFAGFMLRNQATPAGGTPTSTTSATAVPTGPGKPFTMPTDTSSTGRWQIIDRTWTPTGVIVQVQLFADAGTVSYSFQAFENGAQDAVRPVRGAAPDPELTTGTLTAGRDVSGYVFLPLNRGESTLFLLTRSGRAISALAIPG